MSCRVKVQENYNESEENKMLRTYTRRLNLEPYVTLLRVTAYNVNANFQANFNTLQRLPVPKLEDTMAKYLLSVRPFLNNKEFANTINIVKDFQENWAPDVQTILEQRAREYDNWLAEWWLNNAYLEFRESVVVNSSPGLMMPTQKFKDQDEQLLYAAKMLLATLEFKDLVDNGKLPQEKSGKYPLDMSQYSKVLGTCRVPGKERDRLSFNADTDYITVIHNNHIFHVDLWGEDKTRLNEKQIMEQLKKVVQQSVTRNEVGIGYLTSENRDNWAKAYDCLLKDETNRNSLLDVEKSILVLCLDAPIGIGDVKDDDEARTLGGAQVIHGGGSKSNGGNRWFDKTIQFVVGADGLVGMTYEHSPAEGQPIAVISDYILRYIAKTQSETCEPSRSPREPILLKFNINPEIKKRILNAHTHLDKMVDNLALKCFKFKDYGKNFIKSLKLSPDSYLQMAMQYAFYRLHKVPGAHYESAATRMFIGGRTETIRSCSIESIKFAQTMLNSSCTKDKVSAMIAAINGHRNYTMQALQGLGVDRHLLGLKLAAGQNSIPLHKFYTDPGYIRSSHMRLSTSQVAFKADAFLCYGPLVDNGYATCYNPRNDDVIFATSAFNSFSGTDVQDYKDALQRSLIDMKEVMQKNTPSKL